MPTLVAETTVRRPPAVVFEALADLRRYEGYSEHLASVTRAGDGGVGTEYELRFSWWRIDYTVRSCVTAVDRPERLDFEVTSGIDAEGAWCLEPITQAGEQNPVTDDDGPSATRVHFQVSYHPDTVAPAALDLPALTSLSWVIDRVAPLVEREAAGVVQRVVHDLEGSDRAVNLDVTVR